MLIYYQVIPNQLEKTKAHRMIVSHASNLQFWIRGKNHKCGAALLSITSKLLSLSCV